LGASGLSVAEKESCKDRYKESNKNKNLRNFIILVKVYANLYKKNYIS
jgi:hypothetical protein